MSKRKNRTRDLNPKTVRYTIRMSEAENSRLKAMLAEAGCEDNASRFILARIFGWELKVIKIDRGAVNFYSRLSNLYYQFQGVANNYNQVVHAMHREFSPAKARATIAPLVAETRELKRLCEKIVALVDQFNREYLDDSQHHPDGAK